MVTFIVVMVVLFILILLFIPNTSIDQNKKNCTQEFKKKPVLQMLNREGDMHEDEWHTYIAGLPHHASKYDIGGFSGWVEADYNNKYDRNAMGVYNSFGKLLGYIPAKELSEYREWCDAQSQPCVGFIYSEDGQLRGRIKILHPCNEEFLEKEFSRYLQWVRNNYGEEYLPKTLDMTFDIE
ncbi:hypothetical protein HDR66_00495 [bacterium]|nr:hypothetical protein [bacterium]